MDHADPAPFKANGRDALDAKRLVWTSVTVLRSCPLVA
jgi:hypothetical protein